MYTIVMKNKRGPKPKQPYCSICDRKHYAKGYCAKHYRNMLAGRDLDPQKCSCGKKILVHKIDGLCGECFAKKMRENRIKKYKKDGGKWGYKSYRIYKKLKAKKCSKCGSRKNLQMHHVNRNKQDSSIENLLTVCEKCHIEIHRNDIYPNAKWKIRYGIGINQIIKKLHMQYQKIKNLHMSGKLESILEALDKTKYTM